MSAISILYFVKLYSSLRDKFKQSAKQFSILKMTNFMMLGTNESFWDDEKSQVETMKDLQTFQNRAILFNEIESIGRELPHCQNGGRLYTYIPWQDEAPHELFTDLAYICCSRPQVQALLDVDGKPSESRKHKTSARRLVVWLNTTETMSVHVIQNVLKCKSKTDWFFEKHSNPGKKITFKEPEHHSADYKSQFNEEYATLLKGYNEIVVDDLVDEKKQTLALDQKISYSDRHCQALEWQISEMEKMKDEFEDRIKHSESILQAHRLHVRLSAPNRPRSITTGSAPNTLRYDCEKDAKQAAK